MATSLVRQVTFGMKPKAGNYSNVKKTKRHGILFDSRKEADRYDQLLLLEKHGDVRNLRLQVRYEMKVNGILICRYTADFVYEERDRSSAQTGPNGFEWHWYEVVEDVKGYPNERWPMKKKLFKAIFGKEIRET